MTVPRLVVVGHDDPTGGYSADVWGHGDYAYLSSRRGRTSCPSLGVRVYTLRDPANPSIVATFADGSEADLAATNTNKTIVRRVATSTFTGDLAATSIKPCRSDSFSGFGLYDVTNPENPRRLALVRTDGAAPEELWLQAVGNRAYVYAAVEGSEASGSGRADFRIFDVTDPTRPIERGSWSARAALHIRSSGNFVHSVVSDARGSRAFLSYWNLGTVILDVSVPERPRFLGRTTGLARQPSAHSATVSGNGRLLIETHETLRGRAALFDVSRPAKPRLLARFFPPARVVTAGARGASTQFVFEDGVHDAKLVGKTAYFSWYRQGVVVADVSRPAHPRFLARFLPPKTRDPEALVCLPGSSCRAVWGVYPTARYILASDMVSGLWVLRLER